MGIGGLLLSTLMVVYFWPWTSDDAFISFRYARNLAEGHGLVFNPGERVEGYSNFLLVLLLAFASTLSLDIVLVAKLVGVLSLPVIALLAVWLIGRLGGGKRGSAVGFSLSVTATPLAYWAVSGLETAVYAALVLVGVASYILYREGRGTALPTSAVFFAVALLRVEGVVFFLATCAFHVGAGLLQSVRWRPRRAEVMVVAGFALAYGAYLAFRYLYYGSLVPNTVVAKTGYSEQLRSGLSYLAEWLPAGFTLLWLGLRPCLTGSPGRRAPLAYLWWLCGMWTVLVVLFGGDWMPLYRFFVPIMPLLYLLAGLGFASMWSQAERDRERGSGKRKTLAVAFGAALLLNGALPFSQVTPAAFESHLSWDEASREAGLWLRENAAPGSTVAVLDAGRVPFYSDLKTIDTAGLLDPAIARLPGRFESKVGVAAHVLSLRPDYVELNSPGSVQDGRFFPAETGGFFAEPEFRGRYELAFHRDAWRTNPGVRFVLIFRRVDGP